MKNTNDQTKIQTKKIKPLLIRLNNNNQKLIILKWIGLYCLIARANNMFSLN